jgi:hypothetical protein
MKLYTGYANYGYCSEVVIIRFSCRDQKRNTYDLILTV